MELYTADYYAKKVNEIIGLLEEEERRYIFVSGRENTGKTEIIRRVIREAENRKLFKAFYFDVDNLPDTACSFYADIIRRIGEKEVSFREAGSLDAKFILALKESILQKTLLVFDNFRLIQKDYYAHFLTLCRRLYDEPGADHIVMLFGSSFNEQESVMKPLLSVTHCVRIRGIRREELDLMIYRSLEKRKLPFPGKEKIDFIYTSARENLTIISYLLNHLDERAPHLWVEQRDRYFESLLPSSPGELLKSREAFPPPDRWFYNWFYNTFRYLQKFPSILRCVIEYYEEGRTSSSSMAPRLSGLFREVPGEGLVPDNLLLKKFLFRLFDSYTIPDLCLFHSREPYFLNQAFRYYRKLKETVSRDQAGAFLNFGTDHDYPVRQLITYIRDARGLADFFQRFHKVVTLIFHMDLYALYAIDTEAERATEVDEIFYDFHLKTGDIDHTDFLLLQPLIEEAVKSHSPQFDWTGRWLVIPGVIRHGFGRCLLGKINLDSREFFQYLINFIQRFFAAYYYRLSEKKTSEEVAELYSIVRGFHLPGNLPLAHILERGEIYYYSLSPGGKVLSESTNFTYLRILWKEGRCGDYDTVTAFLLEKPGQIESVFDRALRTREIVKVLRKLEGADHHYVFDTVFIPHVKEGIAVSVSVVMHDLGAHQLIWEVIGDLERKNDIREIEPVILRGLSRLGFRQVYACASPGHPRYILEMLLDKGHKKRGKRKIRKKQENFLFPSFLPHFVSVYYRGGRDLMTSQIAERLKGTPYLFTPLGPGEITLADFADKKDWQFFITLSIFNTKGPALIFLLTNRGREFRDYELIRGDFLKDLERLGAAASQILKNLEQKEYLKKLQAMLTHGTLEPLQIMRMFAETLVHEEDRDKRGKILRVLDSNMAMLQSSLGSLLVVRKGERNIRKVKLDLAAALEEQMELYRAFTQYNENFDFFLEKREEPLFCLIDPVILTHLLNNLIGNSIRHLLKLDHRGKQIRLTLKQETNRIMITVSDNGEGLPLSVKNFFRTDFYPGMPYPSSGLGIGFSREMALLLDGWLELREPPEEGMGTTYRLTLFAGRDEEAW